MKLITEEQWQKLTTDDTTGLTVPSHAKSLVHHLFVKADEQKVPMAFIRIDIDNLKIVNDTFGHHKGDAILLLAAETAKNCVRHGMDHLFIRTGGDEQLYILYDIDLIEADKVIRRIRFNFAEGLNGLLGLRQLEGKAIALSIGIEIRKPGDSRTFLQLDQRADELATIEKRIKKNLARLENKTG